jgi:hypothetical protein
MAAWSIPAMLPPAIWLMLCPILSMVSSARPRMSGMGALMPSRGARVARAYPARSMDSAKTVKACSVSGSTITS